MRPSSSSSLVLILLWTLGSLGGCYDFVGDAGKIGFTSTLHAGGQLHWTPALAVASGTTVVVAPTEFIGLPEGQPKDSFDVHGEVSCGLRIVPLVVTEQKEAPGTLQVQQGALRHQGEVRFTGDAEDSFHLRFARAKSADIDDPFLLLAGPAQRGTLPTDRFALPPQAIVPLGVIIRDRNGAELGWNPGDITVESSVPWMTTEMSAEGELKVTVNGSAGGRGLLTLRLHGKVLDEEQVLLVDPLASPRFEVLPIELKLADLPSRALLALPMLADGTPVLQAPVTWTGENIKENTDYPAWMEVSDKPITAHLGERSLTVNP